MNFFKALGIYTFGLVTKGPKYIRDMNTEFLNEQLKENPTIKEVEEAFEGLHGIDVNMDFGCGQTLLVNAIEYCDDLKIAELLIDKGYDLNADDAHPLNRTIDLLIDTDTLWDESKIQHYFSVLRLLLNAGAVPNMYSVHSLVHAGSEEEEQRKRLQIDVLKLLMKYGLSLDLQWEDGSGSLLHECDDDDDIHIIEFALEHGANPNLKDKRGNTPLQNYVEFLSIREDTLPLMELFIKHQWDIDSQNNKGKSFLFDVVERGSHFELLSVLLSYKPNLDFIDIYKRKVLDYAEGEEKEILEKVGASGVFNELDRTLLAEFPYWKTDNHDFKKITTLLEKGANVNVSDGEMRSVLYSATRSENIDLLKLILSYDPELDIAEHSYGTSALEVAAYKDNINIAKLLLEAGANINADRLPDESSALFSVVSLEMLKVFIRYGVNVNAKNYQEQNILFEIVTPQVKNSGLLGGDDEDNEQYIYDSEGTEKIKLLLENGIQFDEDREGNTILHYAARGGSVAFLKLFQESGVSYNLLNNDGETPLHFAAKFGHLDAVKYLVKSGMDIQIVDKYGVTALYESGCHDNEEVEEYLLAQGANPDYSYENSQDVVKGNVDYL